MSSLTRLFTLGLFAVTVVVALSLMGAAAYSSDRFFGGDSDDQEEP